MTKYSHKFRYLDTFSKKVAKTLLRNWPFLTIFSHIIKLSVRVLIKKRCFETLKNAVQKRPNSKTGMVNKLSNATSPENLSKKILKKRFSVIALDKTMKKTIYGGKSFQNVFSQNCAS